MSERVAVVAVDAGAGWCRACFFNFCAVLVPRMVKKTEAVHGRDAPAESLANLDLSVDPMLSVIRAWLPAPWSSMKVCCSVRTRVPLLKPSASWWMSAICGLLRKYPSGHGGNWFKGYLQTEALQSFDGSGANGPGRVGYSDLWRAEDQR
jgi:hypothetical protein